MKPENSKLFHVGDREIEVIADPNLPHGHKPGTGGLMGSKKSQVTVSLHDVEDHECDEPDVFAGGIVEAAHLSLDKTLSVEQRAQLASDIHEWLCETRADAALSSHDA